MLKQTAALAPCGTPAARARHRRRGEPVDEACRRAHTADEAARQRHATAERQAAAGEQALTAETEAEIKAANRRLRHRPPRMVNLPTGKRPLGVYAGTRTLHRFLPDSETGTLCLACFGWCNDARHVGPALAPEVARA